MLNKKFVLANKVYGETILDNFLLVEEVVREIEDREVLVKADWLSVDPNVRFALSDINVGDLIPGPEVGNVIKSKCNDFPVGTLVIGKFGWQQYAIYKPDLNTPRSWRTIAKVDDLKGLSPSYALGCLGMPGNTAYFGVVDILKPQPGETLLVSTAAGAIGSIVGQIGKIRGCKVIGLTSSDVKMEWVKSLGFDIVLNYKSEPIKQLLNKHVPEGIDCYFDSVGGDFLSDVMECMNEFGRVAACGSMSSYMKQPIQEIKVHMRAMNLRAKNLTVYGFNTGRWVNRWSEGKIQLRDWILEGKIKVRECVTTGFEQSPQAFIDMFQGKNVGKVIVKLN